MVSVSKGWEVEVHDQSWILILAEVLPEWIYSTEISSWQSPGYSVVHHKQSTR